MHTPDCDCLICRLRDETPEVRMLIVGELAKRDRAVQEAKDRLMDCPCCWCEAALLVEAASVLDEFLMPEDDAGEEGKRVIEGRHFVVVLSAEEVPV